ncbi:Emopamil-binding [Penicillium fimorum]|uniref:Emopamil-binding n=1 Tax=Penicillium fimorum TaxID=1882269 RepID=A0A9W9XIL9_9EURO|nr:Emopamil-binding [Penicillium fimorum]
MTPLHSYYPVGVEIPSYVPNQWSTLALVSTFAVTCLIALTAAKTIATNVNPRITIPELSKVLWFALCGSIHLILEGYYALCFATLPGSQHLLAQLWKEYSMSDSRYLTSHAFVMSMESITAWCWGPLSFVLAYFIVTDNPFRHPLQLIISTGQLYGDVLYYGTCAIDFLVYGVEYSRPEGYYFYGYFVLLNGFWIVIPALLIADSVRACGRVFSDAKRTKTVSANGNAKKVS